MTLTEFLLARIAEDEAGASRLHSLSCARDVLEFGLLCQCGTPGRVLAECEAKRRLLGHLAAYGRKRLLGHLAAYGHEVVEDFWDGYNAGMVDDLQFLALPYADHPDYRPEWRH